MQNFACAYVNTPEKEGIVLAGGFLFNNGWIVDKKEEQFFDMKTKKWSTLGPLNTGRAYGNNKLMVIKVRLLRFLWLAIDAPCS